MSQILYYKIIIWDDVTLSATAKDDDGNVVDITGATIEFWLQKDDSIYTQAWSVVSWPDGTLQVVITDTNTSDFDPWTYPYYIEVTKSWLIVTRIQGNIQIESQLGNQISSWWLPTSPWTFSTVTVSQYIDLTEISAPSDPWSNIARFYAKDDWWTTKLYFRDSAWNEKELWWWWSISDGDKGDITVSWSGTVWTINDDAITTSKINDDAVTADKLTDTAVTPWSYTLSSITVDAQWRITAASSWSWFLLSDWDKGDITVSSSWTVFTIDSDTVTYDKIQDTSTTDVVLWRSTALWWTVEEISCTAAGRALIWDATSADQRTTLGLWTMATQNASSVAITGWSITGMSTPSWSSDVATKWYVDGLINGLKWKDSVVVKTTWNITLSWEQTIDWVLTSSSRVLVADQTDQTENGIYVSSSLAWSRSSDADTWDELVSCAVFVTSWSTHADRTFVCTNDSIIIWVTNIVFVNQSSSNGALIASNNLSDLWSSSTARTNLWVAIWSDVQAWDTHLDDLAWLTPASSLIIGDWLWNWNTVTPANFITDNSLLTTWNTKTVTNKTIDADNNTISNLAIWSEVSEIIANYLDFTAISAPSHSEWRCYYDSTEKTLTYYNDESEISMNLWRESWIRVYNDTGSTITNWQAVYVSWYDATNDLPEVSLCETDDTEKSRFAGVATHDIENASIWYITSFWRVHDMDTSSFTAWVTLYLDTSTPWGLTETRPQSPNYIMPVAVTVRSHATLWSIFVWATSIHGWNSRLAEKFWNWSIVEDADVDVSSNGTTITLSLQKNWGGDLTLLMNQTRQTFDCTPAATVTLTAWSDTSPQINYVYIPASTDTLTNSTSSFPSEEHVPVATVLCQSASSIQTDWAMKVHVWSDHLSWSDDQGHLSHLNRWIRSQEATWISGVAVTPTAWSWQLDIATSSWVVLQLHEHAYPSFDTSWWDEIYVVNDPDASYTKVASLTQSDGVDKDANGNAFWNSNSDFYNLVLWWVVSEESADCKLMCNLPTWAYGNDNWDQASNDDNNTAVYAIPEEFLGVWFLIARLTIRENWWTYTVENSVDLRWQKPWLQTWGGAFWWNEFSDNVFAIYDEWDNTKILNFQCSWITTATTRTLTIPDASWTITLNDSTATLTNKSGNISQWTNDSWYITGNETITLSWDVTGSWTTAITTTIATWAVDIAMLSATWTPGGTTFLRGDNTWATPAWWWWISLYDATVWASWADYTTLWAAITDSKTRILVIDDTTETWNITLPSNVIVEWYGTNINIDMNSRIFSTTTNTNFTFRNIKITHTSNSLFQRHPSLHLYNVYIDNNSTSANQESIIITGNDSLIADWLTLDLPDQNGAWIVMLDSDYPDVDISNLHIIWWGTSCYDVINDFKGGARIRWLHFSGTFSTTAGQYTIDWKTWWMITNIFNEWTSNLLLKFTDCTVTNVAWRLSGIDIDASTETALSNFKCDTWWVLTISWTGAVVSNVSIQWNITMSGNMWTITCFGTIWSVTVSWDDNTLWSWRVGAVAWGGSNTITVSSWADRCIIWWCRLDDEPSLQPDTDAAYTTF